MPSATKSHAWIETDIPLGADMAVLAAGEPTSVIAGSRADWPRLREFLGPTPVSGAANQLPTRAAIGYFTYEGEFWFGLHQDIEVLPSSAWPRSRAAFHVGPPRSTLEEDGFCSRVLRIQEYIRAGDVYQVNLTRTISAPFDGCPRALFSCLRTISPAPFSAFIDAPDRTILSASPELFLRFNGGGIETRPIKGTRPRFANPDDDRSAVAELVSDAKERAELIMITDLERNDIGRVCMYGSVEVALLAERQSFAQVHHLVSTVRGRLRNDVHPIDVFDACFPGGSITGAPKKRAIEIIAELEPTPRGLYTGAIGFFGLDGISQFNVAIRTIELAGGQVRYGVGSGITIDSDPAREYRETCHKAVGIEAALYGSPVLDPPGLPPAHAR